MMFKLKTSLYINMAAVVLNIAAIIVGSPIMPVNVVCVFISTGLVILTYRAIRKANINKGEYNE